MKTIRTRARTKIKVSLLMIMIFTLGFLSINLSLYLKKQNSLNGYSLTKDFTDNLKLSGTYNDIEIIDTMITNTSHKGNWTWATTQPWFGGGSGTSGDPYIIEGHTFYSVGTAGLCFAIQNSRKHFIVRNCIFRDSKQTGFAYWAGMHLQNTTNGIISNNDFFDNIASGLYIFNSSNNQINGNRFFDNDFDGIRFYKNSSNNIISGNTIYNNSQSGIRLLTGEFNELSGNMIYNHTNSGIYLKESHNNTLASNTIYDSKEHGILCYRSDDTILRSNNISNNDMHGIVLNDSNYVKSYGNWIYNNGEIGINCTSSSGNNQFYENAFLGSHLKHAVDDGSNNIWNSTTIGNYWDNYTTPDANSDGIVDNPYIYIGGSAGSVDYLPIAKPGVPEITITSPNNNDVFSEIAPGFTLNIPNDYYLYHRWYTINNIATTYPFTGVSGTIDQTAWNTLSDGNLTLTFYAQFLENSSSDEVIIQKDTLAPVITIYTPTSGDVFGITPPIFNMTIIDPNLDTVWYIIEDRAPMIIVNVVEFTIPSQTWSLIPEGTANITFYANDTLEHLSFQLLILSKNITGDIPDFWIGLDFFITGLFITLFSGIAISIVIIKIYRKKQIFN